MPIHAAASAARAPLMAFLAMGAFWGTWHAFVPDVKAAVGASDRALGIALLFVAAGAVPSMIAGGRLSDRAGPRLLPLAIAAFALAGILPGLARTPVELSAALLVLGAASGLMDVVMNARVGAVEAATGVRAMHLAHALFAVVYLLAALLSGALRQASIGPLPALAGVLVTGSILALLSMRFSRKDGMRNVSAEEAGAKGRTIGVPVILLGLVAFAAFLAENGWQSWSALFLERTYGAAPWLGSLGPATVGIALAAGRLGGQALSGRLADRSLMAGGAALAAAGGMGAALAPLPELAVAALFLAQWASRCSRPPRSASRGAPPRPVPAARPSRLWE